jgi:hypothetical protein
MDREGQFVWIFNGERSSFPGGVFRDLASAESWISRHALSGVLTKYPLGAGAYDHAIEAGLFSPKKDEQRTPGFIGGFSCAGFEHYHYEAGAREGL